MYALSAHTLVMKKNPGHALVSCFSHFLMHYSYLLMENFTDSTTSENKYGIQSNRLPYTSPRGKTNDTCMQIHKMNYNHILIVSLILSFRLLPVIPLAITFGTLAVHTNIISGASDCSCWCLPELGNILPYAIPRDNVRPFSPPKLL